MKTTGRFYCMSDERRIAGCMSVGITSAERTGRCGFLPEILRLFGPFGGFVRS
ncbi:hypothetical protein [Fibrisoma montanum]|uniref:hypothetical protein n=1 Tax=Fibrisoma montanum TaxID=2305895 RepID=UPI0013145C58|nr:hypothetical protein [Fibrisoma montanum]